MFIKHIELYRWCELRAREFQTCGTLFVLILYCPLSLLRRPRICSHLKLSYFEFRFPWFVRFKNLVAYRCLLSKYLRFDTEKLEQHLEISQPRRASVLFAFCCRCKSWLFCLIFARRCYFLERGYCQCMYRLSSCNCGSQSRKCCFKRVRPVIAWLLVLCVAEIELWAKIGWRFVILSSQKVPSLAMQTVVSRNPLWNWVVWTFK